MDPGFIPELCEEASLNAKQESLAAHRFIFLEDCYVQSTEQSSRNSKAGVDSGIYSLRLQKGRAED